LPKNYPDNSRASSIIEPKNYKVLSILFFPGKIIIITENPIFNPILLFSRIAIDLFVIMSEPRIHNSAYIHP